MFFWVVLALGLLVAGVYPLAVAVLASDRPRLAPDWSMARTADGSLRVTAVDPRGNAAGMLHVGERVIGMNGHAPLVEGLGWVVFMDLRPGDTYTLRVESSSGVRDVVGPATFAPRDRAALWFVQVPLLVVSFAFFATGVAIGLFRPADTVARLYAVAALIIAASLVPSGVFIGEPLQGAARAMLNAAALLQPFLLPVVFHFFTAFPPEVQQGRLAIHVRRLLYGWALVVFPGATLTRVVVSRDAASAAAAIEAHGSMFLLQDRLTTALVVISLVAIVAVLIRNHTAAADADARRRFRWVFWGSAASAIPFAALFVAQLLMEAVGRGLDYFVWMRAQSIAQLSLLFLPVTFSYAVLTRRVVGVEVVIRRGLQYVLARHVLRAAILLPLVLLAVRVVSNQDRTIAAILFERPIYAALAVAAAAGLASRERLTRWLDRKFFRDASDRERVLVELAAEIMRSDTVEKLAARLYDGIDRSLHPTSVHLFLHDRGSQLRRVEPSAASDGSPALSTDSEIVRVLSDARRVLQVPFATASLPAAEAAWLDALGARLAVPVGGGTAALSGVLLLGEKRSEEPYGRQDCALLEAVAGQLAIVLENARLKDRASEHARVVHDVLAHVDDRAVNLLKECPLCGTCYDRADDTCAHDGAALTFTLPVDRDLDGKYRLARLIGRGGMGAVYEAMDVRLGRTVAVKLMRGASLDSETARRRFDREARAAARLRHPNIVTVHDYGHAGIETAYIVMERLVGTTLRVEIDRSGGLPPERAAAWCDQILNGVQAAHAAGVIHRDLKPENIFVARTSASDEATLKVLDFGLAKLRRPDIAESLTESGVVMGTLAYASPEQLSGTTVDEGTDLFALGIIAFELLIGANPFRRDNATRTVAAILGEQVASVGDAPDFAMLNEVLQRALAKDPHDRFRSAAELRSSLIPALRNCPPIRGSGEPAQRRGRLDDDRTTRSPLAP